MQRFQFYDLVDDGDEKNQELWTDAAQKAQKELQRMGLRIQDFGDLNQLEDYSKAS